MPPKSKPESSHSSEPAKPAERRPVREPERISGPKAKAQPRPKAETPAPEADSTKGA